MIFYTTNQQEELLDIKYNELIKIKNNEIKEREKKTGKIEKFSAYAFVKKDPRVFYWESSQLFIIINGKKVPHDNFNLDPMDITNKNNLIGKKKNFGQIYKTDSDFDTKVKNFISLHPNWMIIFYPHKAHGCVGYVSTNEYDIPAELKSLDSNDILVLEDSDKYDLFCG